MKTRRPVSLWSLSLLLLSPAMEQAHVLPGEDGFVSGLVHPVLGCDHLLAMVSVGILSAQIGGRALWNVPAAFLSTMVLGGVLGLAVVPIPSVPTGIAVSVMALGAAIAAAPQMPIPLGMIFVGVFGIFHGHVHGVELPYITRPWLYAAGFILGTAGLHLTGVGLGLVSKITKFGPVTLRLAGAAISCFGVSFYLGF